MAGLFSQQLQYQEPRQTDIYGLINANTANYLNMSKTLDRAKQAYQEGLNNEFNRKVVLNETDPNRVTANDKLLGLQNLIQKNFQPGSFIDPAQAKAALQNMRDMESYYNNDVAFRDREILRDVLNKANTALSNGDYAKAQSYNKDLEKLNATLLDSKNSAYIDTLPRQIQDLQYRTGSFNLGKESETFNASKRASEFLKEYLANEGTINLSDPNQASNFGKAAITALGDDPLAFGMIAGTPLGIGGNLALYTTNLGNSGLLKPITGNNAQTGDRYGEPAVNNIDRFSLSALQDLSNSVNKLQKQIDNGNAYTTFMQMNPYLNRGFSIPYLNPNINDDNNNFRVPMLNNDIFKR